MKKITCAVLFFAFLANMSAQLKIDATGQLGITNPLNIYD
jgi:hypothetical protein